MRYLSFSKIAKLMATPVAWLKTRSFKRNPIFEYRNSKQIRISKFLNSKPVLKFEDSSFELVSDFGFRASNLKN